MMKKSLNIKNISMIAILASIGAFLMFLDFPIFIAPSFYKLDLSDLPCLIGAFSMGPIPALFIQIIKILIKLLLKPTSTAFVGEIASFSISSIYCVVASIIYKHNRNKKGAIKAIVISSIAMVISSCILNYVFIIPSYVKLFGMPLETIVSLGNKIIPLVKDKLSFVMFCVAPFNCIKAIIIDVLTISLYKHISPLLKSL